MLVFRVALCFLICFSALAETTVNVNIAAQSYSYQLLELALKLGRRDETYTLKQYPLDEVSFERRLRMLEEGKFVDVMALAVNNERMTKFRAIQQPIRFGLLGLRILLTSKDSEVLLGGVTSVDDLKRLRGGFVKGWAEDLILDSNELLIHYATNPEIIYAMLSQGRIDYFPRSIFEVIHNYDTHIEEHPNLAIEKTLALYYPIPTYFFVKADNEILAEVIERGLIEANKQGALEALYVQHYGDEIKALELDKRKIIRMVNPELPKDIVLPSIYASFLEKFQKDDG